MTLPDLLGNISEIDADTAENIQQTLLEQLTLPAGWQIRDLDVELTADESGDWFLCAFEHESHPDTIASVFILPGSHTLQLYFEQTDEWSDTTQNPTEIEQLLATQPVSA